jgi:hypothetical protein
LKDINQKLSKRIRKKIKKRKKIEKFIHSLELKRKEKNNNLKALYSNIISEKLNMISNNKNILTDDISNNIKNNLPDELINKTLSEYTNDNFSELLDSTTSEEDAPKKFNINSLKKITPISFEIKSAYRNINLLSKGEIVLNKNYRVFLQNMIKKNTTKHFFNKAKFKRMVSSFSIKAKKHNNNDGYLRSSTDKCKKVKKSDSVKRNTFRKSKFQSDFLTTINKSSNIIMNMPAETINNNFDITNKKNISKENEVNDKNDKSNIINCLNKSNIKYETNNKENKNINIKINNDITNYYNIIKDGRRSFQNDSIEKSKKMSMNCINNNNTLMNNKSYASSLNCFNELDKDNITKNENNLKILNKKDTSYSSYVKDIYINNENNKKKCIVF